MLALGDLLKPTMFQSRFTSQRDFEPPNLSQRFRTRDSDSENLSKRFWTEDLRPNFRTFLKLRAVSCPWQTESTITRWYYCSGSNLCFDNRFSLDFGLEFGFEFH